MNSLDTGKDKIRKICEIIEKETLAPAQEEAANLLQEAQLKAQKMILEAREKAEALIGEAKAKIAKERELFMQSLKQGFNGAKEQLRQDIEATLFNQTFVPWVEQQTGTAEVGAKLVTALVEAIAKEGTEGDLSVVVAQHIKPEELKRLLGDQILKRIKEKAIAVGAFRGGVQIKLHQQHLTLDLSDQAIVDLLVSYIAKEFRDVIFQT